MVAKAETRVEQNTSRLVDRQIWNTTRDSVEQTVQAGHDAIDERLRALQDEWDVERVLETAASSLTLMGLGLTLRVDRRFWVLPTAVAGFLLQHALQGWCPPLPIVRRLGVRTRREIDAERYALKVRRGDFESAQSPTDLLRAAHRA